MHISRLLSAGERNVTLASKRKMSQRQKTSRSSQSTQTDLSGAGTITTSSSSSWSLLDAAAINGIAAGELTPLYGSVEMPPMSPPAPLQRGSTSSSLLPPPAAAAGSAVSQQLNGEFYEDAATLFDKLVKAEEVGRNIYRAFSDRRG